MSTHPGVLRGYELLSSLRPDQQTGDVYHRERRQIMPGLGGRTGEGGGVFVWVVCVVARIGQSVHGALV